MKIKFLPQNIDVDVVPGQSILDTALKNDIYIKSVCKGVPSCAECRIKVKEGDYNILAPGPKELSLIGTAYYVDQRRLACQSRCFGDVVVDLTEQLEKQEASPKKPRGKVVKDEGESVARAGNIMQTEMNEGMVRYDQKIRKAEELLMKQEQKRAIDRIKNKKLGKTEED
jgi:ferredoxin